MSLQGAQAMLCILVHTPEYNMEIQAHIPPALAATHNFICDHDPDEIFEFKEAFNPQPGSALYGKLGTGPSRHTEVLRATSRCDRIAQAMWTSYQTITRGLRLE